MNITWNSVRSIGNSKTAKLSILMPIIGYIILNLDLLNKYLDKSGLTIINSSWLYYFYFGSVLTGTASILYHVFCASIVKRFDNERAFSIDFLSMYNNFEIENMSKYIICKNVGIAEIGRVKSILTVSKGDGKIGETNAMYVSSIYYISKSKENNFALYCCIILYSLGISIISIPTILSMLNVIKLMI